MQLLRVKKIADHPWSIVVRHGPSVESRSTTLVLRDPIEGVVCELFDVAVLPGIRNPVAIGFKTDEIRRLISIDDAADVVSI